MISGFLFLTFLILVLAWVSLFILDRNTQVARIHANVSQLQIYTLSLIKSDNDFFDLETINDNYFKTHQSDFLIRHDSLNQLISEEIRELCGNQSDKNEDTRARLVIIDSTLQTYHARFKQLEEMIFKRGFKDYGIEGAMRFHAHALERLLSDTYVENVLYLRRHEKDFLLRNDTSYLRQFRSRCKLLELQIDRSLTVTDSALFHLHEYQRLFQELASIQMTMGLSSKQGLRNQLNNLTKQLSQQYFALTEYHAHHAEDTFDSLRFFYIALLTGAILFSLISGYWISRKLSAPIANLSNTIRASLRTGHISKADLKIKNAAVEITTLASAFLMLMEQTRAQVEKIKLKSNQLKEKNHELKKLNRELDNFLYSTAHDLRSPLSSLLGLINIMRYENQQPELTHYLNMMEASLHRSDDFISQIVSFSKNKRLKITPERLDIRELLKGIFDDHQFIEGAATITKTINIDEFAPFHSDRKRMVIILSNLVSNAIKYADYGKPQPSIHVVVKILAEEALIEFSDNGIGIEHSHLSHIFEMFYRAHSTSKGSGLGLFIFKETVTRLGGEIHVESTPTVGTRFILHLPNMSGGSTTIEEPTENEVLAIKC